MSSTTTTTTTTNKPQINNKDLLALKSYIQAKDNIQYDSVNDSIIILDLTHSNLIQKHIEIRFYKHDTISQLRSKIHQKTGTSSTYQHLQIKSCGQILYEIPPPSSSSSNDIDYEQHKLGYFNLSHGMEIYCIDTNPLSGSKGGQYEDTTLIQKYVMSDDEYNKRKNTLRDWERQQKQKDNTFTLAKHAKQHRELVEAQRQYKLKLPLPNGFQVINGKVVRCDDDDDDEQKNIITNTNTTNNNNIEYDQQSIDGMIIGQRCQVQPGKRRGCIAYIGLIPELPNGGYWVGIQFDEPVGKTDGTIKGTKYFTTISKHGGFVRGKHVQVGDFPERDIFDELDDDSSEDEL